MADKVYNLVILGAGPAGLTAGIYAGRARLEPLIIEGKSQPGGQLMGTTYIENWPGHTSILGPQLMMNMKQHAQHTGCTFLSEDVVRVNFGKKPFLLATERQEIFTHALIIATGADPKKLTCPGEDTYWGKGVSTCAVCDGALYHDKPIIIVGGGDTALENASFMTNFTKDITLIHIGKKLTASTALQERIKNNTHIKLIYESTVTSIEGNGQHVTDVTITNQVTQQKQTLPAAAVFIAIGLIPNTAIFKNQLDLTPYGYLVLRNDTHTSVPGIFGAGDVADYRYRQAITAAGAGCMAALDAERYLKNL